ncbi:hypothetical protein [Sediminibacterium ginsengisoli]|uniref:Peptidase MA superfamily protein n=1 Tax=Sediminibacterium ginsengisoli TaxID=413434 RepID=A0A1T4JP36_9BACT|nr:hypothetical protein [Sediminibacterium ginsengisoli]SJZ31911.1 hypothetical protein SAMN04488132_1015 [Sediminibacterium ginsengisoli]
MKKARNERNIHAINLYKKKSIPPQMKLIALLTMSFLYTVAFAQKGNPRLDQFLNQLPAAWKKHQSDHFILFVEPGQYADQHANLIRKNLETTRQQIVHFLNDSSFADTANIIIVDSKEKIKRLLGFEAQGFAIPENNIVVFLHNSNYSLATKHELTHYYAFHIWGKPANNWFSEGLAVYYDNTWSRYQVDSLCKYLKNERRLFNLTALTKDFYALNAMIAYPQIGSFTGFLLVTYGNDKLRELWEKGFKEVKKIYRKSLKDLEEEWLRYLDKFASDHINYPLPG